ncbi:9435_t:CDS:2 [Cetraspora pellucida]|uniref:cellulase n=1 Tax=Cetraspora pellucida TaxID=1433469 RepID=A0A9N9N6K5_9GLOM|nr:9435_t:CDS:2 [Cetraspora pellucida]
MSRNLSTFPLVEVLSSQNTQVFDVIDRIQLVIRDEYDQITLNAKTSLGLISSPDIPGIPKEGNDYSKLLAYSLYFYEAQRSGILPQNNRVSWRHNSALDDGKDRAVNLSGVSDYVKFTLPLSWVLSLISWGAIEWFEGYRLSNQTDYLHDMVKWGTDWLIAAHSKPDQLFIQVGSSQIDNAYWGPDTSIPYPRPAYDINATAHGTDVAADAAAAFASSAILFRDFFDDPDYAEILITHAISVYNFAENATLKVASTGSSTASYGYSSSSYNDKLVYGALWLYRATSKVQYLDKAINYYNQFQMHDSSRVFSWDDQTGVCNILLAQIFHYQSNANTTLWRGEAERYLDRIMMTNQSNCSLTHGGLLWCNGDSQSGSLPIALYSVFGFLMYSTYASTTEKSNAYKNFSASQIDYLFGANPMNIFYIVSVHPNSPKNPHHAGAHGGTNVANLSDPINTRHPLYGAVVGGPNINDSYLDLRSDVIQSEVALDYNAAFQGIMAYYVINTYVPPSTSPSPNPEPTSPFSIPISKLSNSQKLIIITISCGVFLLLLISSIIIYKYRHKIFKSYINNRKKSKDLEGNNRAIKSLDAEKGSEPKDPDENNQATNVEPKDPDENNQAINSVDVKPKDPDENNQATNLVDVEPKDPDENNQATNSVDVKPKDPDENNQVINSVDVEPKDPDGNNQATNLVDVEPKDPDENNQVTNLVDIEPKENNQATNLVDVEPKDSDENNQATNAVGVEKGSEQKDPDENNQATKSIDFEKGSEQKVLDENNQATKSVVFEKDSESTVESTENTENTLQNDEPEHNLSSNTEAELS